MTQIVDLGPLQHPRGVRTLVMGILNVTPDSFSDGGRHDAPPAALAHARRMVAEGADILDIGGESTRPGSTEISAADEMARVLPVLPGLADLGVAISIDTYKAEVAARALAAGAHVINDVWGLQRDPDMARVAADLGAPVIVMHNRNEADEALDVIAEINRFFDRSLEIAEAAGLRREKIILDPGIGFGKTYRQNLIVLNRLGEFARHGLPLLVGASRKRFIGVLTGRDAPDRLAGSLAAHVLAAGAADIVRVHDVAAHVEALAVADAIRGGGA